MRRLVPTVLLALLAVCVSPAPAHAYFWEWLDSLSGPRFGGLIVELQVACGTENLAESKAVLAKIRRRFDLEATRYAAASKEYTGEAQVFARNAADYLREASILLDEARGRVDKPVVDRMAAQEKEERNVRALVLTALAWQARAAETFDWATRLQHGGILDPRRKPADYKQDVGRMDVSSRIVPLAGVRYSLCDYRALDRDRHVLSAIVGLGIDIKNDDNHSPGRHLMLMTGGSYHFTAKPWLSVGAGAGIATFFPSGADTFAKGYVQPWIVDVKPLAMVERAELRSPWRHFFYVRYSTITFPGGFGENRFNPGSEAYPTELVHSLGVHFDLTPVLRGKKGNW